MIEAWAGKLAASIKKANNQETISIGVMTYALIIVINIAIPTFMALLIGLVTGKFTETLLSILALVLIRAVSGGYHFTSTICIIISTIVVALPPHISVPDPWNLYITVISFTIFAILAPANIKGYARMPEKYFPLMKILSLVIVSSNFVLMSSILTLIFGIQAISLFFKNKEVNV